MGIHDFTMEFFSLKGKNAIVTGGNTGLGQSFVFLLPPVVSHKEKGLACREAVESSAAPPRLAGLGNLDADTDRATARHDG